MSPKDTAMTASQAATQRKLPSQHKNAAFPASEIVAVLHEEFVSVVAAEAELLEIQLPDEFHDVSQMAFDIDSLAAIEILTAVEIIVGIDLPSSVVKAGGYESINDAVETLLPNIEEQWNKHNGKNQ